MRKGHIHGTIGLEIEALSLAEPVTEAAMVCVRQLLDEFGVLIIRDQSIGEQELIRFSVGLGDLATFHEPDKRSLSAPEIFRISNVEQDGRALRQTHDPVSTYFTNITRRWHTDGSYKAVPALATCLLGLEVPPEGGDTLFADMATAYEGLSPSMQATLAGRHMVHNYENNMEITPGHRPMSPEEKALLPPVTHPVVRRCANGREALYLSDNVARYIGGMPIAEGAELLQELLAWSTQPQFVYRHCWQPRDLLIWDNRRVMHQATAFDMARHRRVMLRTEIVGEDVVV
ncbi:MAG: TauD/TfdA family dioxygenase [Chromatiales bacterium]|jgi:alpha-ketoglutarate-dependent taurine dioxygenase|nr:TauD/TfdA family dioxygenase [Chromatiales bacterium]